LIDKQGAITIQTTRIKCIGIGLLLLLSQLAYALDAAKYHGGSYDGYGLGTSPDGQILGTILVAKYYGGSYDGHGLGTSPDGQILGTILAAKYYGGSYDGYGSSISASGIALRKVMLATLMAKPGNRMVTLTLVPESGLDCAEYRLYRSTEKTGLFGRINADIALAKGDSASPPEYRFTDSHVENGVTYWYKIAGVSADGAETTAGMISATPAASAADLPKTFSLSQNFPNPFNPLTEIRYQLPEASRVSITIYDELGRNVIVLLDGDKEAGEWSVVWDASNSASGFYFVRMQTQKFVGVRKMVLVK
jgi:hypothetical protein